MHKTLATQDTSLCALYSHETRSIFNENLRKFYYSTDLFIVNLFVRCLASLTVQSSETQYHRRGQGDASRDHIKIQNRRHSPANQISGCPGRWSDVQLCCGALEQRFTRLEVAYIPG